MSSLYKQAKKVVGPGKVVHMGKPTAVLGGRFPGKVTKPKKIQ